MAPFEALSVVVPAHDEAPNLPRLLEELHAALDPRGLDWELVLVDDGSTDETPTVLARLAARDPRLRPVRLPERRGQTAALVAGFQAARGPLIATLDADLQCAPSDLPELLDALGDADMACGVRSNRRDPPTRRLASLLANAARRSFLAPHVRDLACPLRVFRAAALERVMALTPLFDGAHRWLPALFWLAGLRVVQRPIVHHPRAAGTSKYTTRGRLLPIARELGMVAGLTVRHSPGRRAAALGVLLALAAVPFLYRLGVWPLMDPDEGRNAEVAREMLVLGNWSLPHFNLLPYLDKPVLLFWATAAAYWTFGVTELAARLPAALAGVATVALTFALGRLLFGGRRALLAAAIVASAPLVIVFGRLAIFDLPLTAFAIAALYCLVRARLEGRPALWLPLAGVAMGLATLTKGPVGIAVPLLGWFAGRGALAPPRTRAGWGPVAGGIALWALLVVPWVVLVSRQEPAFLHYALFDETLLRLTSVDRFHRGAPGYYYAEVLAWGLGVWSILLVALVPTLWRRYRDGSRQGAAIAFLVRASAALLVFFTLSASKRPAYVLPVAVLFGLLTAAGIAEAPAYAGNILRRGGRWAVLVGVALIIAAVRGTTPQGGDFYVLTPVLLRAAGIFCLTWGTVTALFTEGRPRLALACAVFFMPGLGATLHRPLTDYAEGRSSRMLAQQIDPGARVICFETFRTGLPFYLGRPVILASDGGHELTSNYVIARRSQLTDRPELMPSAAAAELLGSGARVDAIASAWNVHRLSRLTAAQVHTVYVDRRSVLLRAGG